MKDWSAPDRTNNHNTMMTEPNTAQSIVDGQLAELQITSAEVTGATYKEQHDAKIKALAEEEAALPTPTDKATLQVVQDFITKSEKARTGIDKWRKAFKDQWKKIIDPVDAYVGTNKESGMQARIYAIQERAEAKKKAYLDEQVKAQREADRLLEERYAGRVSKLIAAGMTQQVDTLVIEHDGQTMSALLSQVRFATDEQMAGVLGKVEGIAERKREAEAAALQAKEAQEREEAEERERLRVQKEEQDAAAAKLEADRKQLEREREEMADHRAETRGADLVVLGATAHGYGPAVRYEIGEVIVGHGELRHMDMETWIATRERVRLAKVKAIEEQKERERRNTLVETRSMVLRDAGATYDGQGAWKCGEWETTDAALARMTSDEFGQCLELFGEANRKTLGFKEAAEARDKQPAIELVPDPNGPSEVWTDPGEWAKRVAEDGKPETIRILNVVTDHAPTEYPNPNNPQTDIAGAQPEADPLDAEATAWVVEPFDNPEEAAQWENSDEFLRHVMAYKAGYRAAMREM